MHQHALDDAVGSAAMLDNLFEIAGGVASISRRMSSASKATAGGGRPPQLAQRPREFARVARGGIGGVTGGSGLGAEARLAQLGVGVDGPTPHPRLSTRLAPRECNSGRIATTAGCGSSQSARPSLVDQRLSQASTADCDTAPSIAIPSALLWRQTMPSCLSCATTAASRPSQSDSTSVGARRAAAPARPWWARRQTAPARSAFTISRSPCVICCRMPRS